jgi:hypothetical protein
MSRALALACATALTSCGSGDVADTSLPDDGGARRGDSGGGDGGDVADTSLPDDGGASRPALHFTWSIHVEGDSQHMTVDDPACGLPTYQTGVGKPDTFDCDLRGLEEIQREAERHVDSSGRKMKLDISAAAEFFETELDATYGNQVFRTYDWTDLGHELSIQGHAIVHSEIPYCWPRRPASQDGVAQKLRDLDAVAKRWSRAGRSVVSSVVMTPGAKLEVGQQGVFGDPAEAAAFLDHVGYALGYRLSLECAGGPRPDDTKRLRVYQIDYGDGVVMNRLCPTGQVVDGCDGGCASPIDARADIDQALAAAATDPDPSHQYAVVILTHAPSFCPALRDWPPARNELVGALNVLAYLDELVQRGHPIAYTTLAALLEQ